MRKLSSRLGDLAGVRRRPIRVRGDRLGADLIEQLEDRVVPATYIWAGGSSANWSDPANWGGAGFPSLPGDIAQFTAPIGTAQTINVDVAASVGEIDFGATDAYTLAAGGGSLTLDNSGSPAVLSVTAVNTKPDVINAPVTLAAGLNATLNGTGTSALTVASLSFGGTAAAATSGTEPLTIGAVTLNGTDTLTVGAAGATITGNIGNAAPTDTLVAAGTGTLNLPNANTDTNPTVLNGATLNLGNAAGLGTGPVTLTSGTIRTSTAALTIANPLTFNNNGAVTLGGANAFTLSGAVTLNGNDTLTLSDTGGATLTGAIGNTAPTDTLTLAGTQTVNLPNANTDTNATVINGPTVAVGDPLSLGTGGVTLTAGTLQAMPPTSPWPTC